MKMKIMALIGVISAITLAVIIAVVATSVTGSPASDPQIGVLKAVVVFNVGSSPVSGFLELSQAGAAAPVIIKGNLSNLTPQGEHGFHVHQLGDIRNGCASTKGHYNPYGKTHGAPSDTTRHVGDLGNILADDKGLSNIDITDSLLSLSGENSILGRAFVIHEKIDDLGKGGDAGSLATGNAGSRLKCGIIGVAE